MSFLLDLVMGDLLPWLLGAAAAIGLYFTGMQKGKTNERLNTRLRDTKNANDIEDKIDEAAEISAADTRSGDERLSAHDKLGTD